MTSRHEPIRNTKALKPELEDVPGFVDGIPVEELVRIARELTDRINNEDRQRLAGDLNESGHSKAIQVSAPYLLQGFFSGKLDLDVELNRRFPSPPLLSTMTFAPRPGQHRKHGFAQFTSQDTAATMTMEIHSTTNTLECSFLHYSMIGVRFTLGPLQDDHRRYFLNLLDRPSGIAVLWSRERWERDYLIFVIREHFVRLFAFGPGRVEAACRLTPDALSQLRAWLAGFWAGDPPAESSAETGLLPR
jgi:hypothetical protein